MSIILSCLSNMIEQTGLPEELEQDFGFFLANTLLTGSGFIVKDSAGNPHYTHGTLTEPWDDFGFGKNYITHTVMGTEYKGTLNKDGCIIFPYSSRRPINTVHKTAKMLTEIDLSTEFLVKWAKVAPFLIGKDSKTISALQETVKSVMSGNLHPMLSENLLANMGLDGNGEPIISVDVMQPERIRDLQYLNEHRENVLKNIYNIFGIPVQTGTKRAQQTTDEINGFNGSCFILPYDIKQNFNRFATNLNKVFGWNVKFNLNPLILSELEKYFNEQESDRNVGENIRDELNGETPEDNDSGRTAE